MSRYQKKNKNDVQYWPGLRIKFDICSTLLFTVHTKKDKMKIVKKIGKNKIQN